ncbi:MAG: LysM peptidoglycan-binding domain-containing protein [Tissierellia bacterium]|nr:LysM peptidoglycan-binding domain-containing protein [Tissierellia bacterium]
MKGITIKYKHRLIAIILLIAFFNMGILLISDETSSEFTSSDNYEYTENFIIYTVKEGDTLWNIVSNNIEYIESNNNNFHQIIDQISKCNHLDNKIIKPGQILNIPTKIE